MLTYCRLIAGWTIVLSLFAEFALADSPSRPAPASNSNPDTPVCYMQIQASATIDLSRLCGKNSQDSAMSQAPVVNVSVPSAAVPKLNQASSAPDRKCYFIDENGQPCANSTQ